MRRFPPAALLALLSASVAGAQDADAPFPAGMTTRKVGGLQCSVVVPADYDLAKEHSMVVILHGNGGTDTGMAGSLHHLAAEDYVVVAPKSRGTGWSDGDVEDVKAIVRELRKSLNIGAGRLHGAGFSNGGWNLANLVFDEDFRFSSACWIAAGYNGGKVPKYAKKEMGVLALAGDTDGNRPHAEKTPDLLADRVRSAECRIDAGKGHEWPSGQIPYYSWWLGVQEGRFVPGACLSFPWKESEAAALAAMGEGKAGGFAYWFSKDDGESEEAKTFQNEVLQDPLVRRFGDQIAAWKRERSEGAEDFAAEGLRETPAVVVYDRKGKVVKTLEGKISAAKLAAALRSVAPDKSLPKRRG